jgi:hypothetical protein
VSARLNEARDARRQAAEAAVQAVSHAVLTSKTTADLDAALTRTKEAAFAYWGAIHRAEAAARRSGAE